jgi:nitrogen fixation/metabolism regulation signal transduction histidine kinase
MEKAGVQGWAEADWLGPALFAGRGATAGNDHDRRQCRERRHGSGEQCIGFQDQDDVKTAEVAVMIVADDGAGRSTANAAHAFDPFFTKARGQGGTWLGHAIARSLIEGAGGSIALTPRRAALHL